MSKHFIRKINVDNGSYDKRSLSKNSLVVTLNLFQGLPELASGLKQVQHDILHCIINF
jgi:hypothetical protein